MQVLPVNALAATPQTTAHRPCRPAAAAQVPDLRGHGVRPVHGADRHPDRRRLAERVQAGLSAGPDEISWVQTGYLMAELVMIPFSAFLAQALSTRWLFALSAGTVHPRQRAVRHGLGHRVDDRVPRDPGLRRRRDGADRVRHRLRAVHRAAARADPGDPRHGLGAGADAGADRRRLAHRGGRLALDLLRQHRAGHCRHRAVDAAGARSTGRTWRC